MHQRAELRDAGLRAVDDDRHPGAVCRDAQTLAIGGGRLAIVAAVVIEVGAILATEELDARQPAVADRLQPATAEAEDRLLEAAAEIPSPARHALREQAVGAAIAEDGAGLVEVQALGLVGHGQQRAAPVALVLHEHAAGDLLAGALESGVAVVAVGDEFHQRLLDRGEPPRVDVDDALIDGDCIDGHRQPLCTGSSHGNAPGHSCQRCYSRCRPTGHVAQRPGAQRFTSAGGACATPTHRRAHSPPPRWLRARTGSRASGRAGRSAPAGNAR